jgi:hypothetical protein
VRWAAGVTLTSMTGGSEPVQDFMETTIRREIVHRAEFQLRYVRHHFIVKGGPDAELARLLRSRGGGAI